MRYKAIIIVSFLVINTFVVQAEAYARAIYKEVNMLGGYSDRNEWIGEKGMMLKNSVGFEYFDKFSNDYGDFLTVDLQMRVAYDSQQNSEDAWAVEFHNAWVEHKFGLGKTLRLGHFDPVFGLEPVLDTHGALLQTLAHENIGFKKDWGVGYRSYIGELDYEIAAQLGSGMSIRHKDDSFLLTARVGSTLGTDFQYGISALWGQTLKSMQARTLPVPDLISDDATRKERLGLDARYEIGSFGFKGEIAGGREESQPAGGGLFEIDYIVPKLQALQFKVQQTYWSNDLENSDAKTITLSHVISYKVTSYLTVRAGYFHDVYEESGNEDDQVFLQFYFFG
ncbi:MAG: hypothetical protein JW938_02370 [Candidatus Omnitrophica bacterium]|nr:hypothetical protein [Candidatus Omnitrophota bacterium]